MTKQILAFLFCFTRELNPYSPLRARTQNPHPSARELKPLLPPKARGFIKPLVLTLTLRPEVFGADHEETLDAAMRALTVGEEEEDEEGEEEDSDRGEEEDQAGDSGER